MTQCWLGVFGSWLLLASVGCRLAERQPDVRSWESDLVVAPANATTSSAPVAASIEPRPIQPPYVSSASVWPVAASFAEEIATPPSNSDLLGEPLLSDVPFEIVDAPPPTSDALPPCDFISTLSPRAQCFFSDGVTDFDTPSRWDITRHHCGEDIRCGWQRVKRDYRNYYSWDGLGFLAVGFGLGAVAANTNVDHELQEWWQEDVRTSGTDDFARWAKGFGEGPYMVGAAAAGWLAGEVFYDRPMGSMFGEWGGRTLRSIAVGAPPMLLAQPLTGGSRPDESHNNSRWRPLNDNNGVSGHSFIGALPFINAAKMSENIPLKVGFYACSLAPGWSRVNDDAHYTSQMLLGWWMAYWASTAVDLTNRGEQSNWSVVNMSMGDGTGVGLVYSY